MKLAILTLFPSLFENLSGLVQTAREENIFTVDVIPLRNYGLGKHKKVDDQVFGGSDGMLLSPEVLSLAVKDIKSKAEFTNAKTIALTPKGKKWTQKEAKAWAQDSTPKILICGRYAGFDQRFLEQECDEEISIGDFILNGGEVAALAIIESVARLLPGVLSNDKSAVEDSFSGDDGLLEAPQYTRPSEWEGKKVPDILLSGHHENIEIWKQATSIIETYLKRQDLLKDEDAKTLKRLLKNHAVYESLKQVYKEDDLKKINNWCY